MWSKGLVSLYSSSGAPSQHYMSHTPTTTTIARDSVNTAVRLFALGAWKVFHAYARKVKRKKGDLLEWSTYHDLVMPFKHWKLYMVEAWTSNAIHVRVHRIDMSCLI